MRPALHIIAVSILVMATTIGVADTEAPNQPHVKAGPYGACYVKSVPSEHWGTQGSTRLYRVQAGDDELLATYDWFSQEIHLNCHVMHDGVPGVSLVRFGPWPRGHEARHADLALAFYFNGRELATYSNLDIAGTPGNVDASVSHYAVFGKIEGFRHSGTSGAPEFVVETSDGRTIVFDIPTGGRR